MVVGNIRIFGMKSLVSSSESLYEETFHSNRRDDKKASNLGFSLLVLIAYS